MKFPITILILLHLAMAILFAIEPGKHPHLAWPFFQFLFFGAHWLWTILFGTSAALLSVSLFAERWRLAATVFSCSVIAAWAASATAYVLFAHVGDMAVVGWWWITYVHYLTAHGVSTEARLIDLRRQLDEAIARESHNREKG